MTVDEVRSALRKACDKAGSLRAWARSRGISAAYVSDVQRGQRAPGPVILEALGLEAERTETTVYRRRK